MTARPGAGKLAVGARTNRRLSRWLPLNAQPSETAFSIVVALVACFLVLYPLGWLIWGAFHTGAPGAPGEFTFANFADVLLEGAYWELVLRSVFVGVCVTLLATAIGTPLAWLIARTDLPGKRIVEFGALLPFFTSSFIGALAWIFLGNPSNGLLKLWFGLPVNIYSIGGIIWVAGIYMAPYMYLFSLSALRNIDTSLEEASFMSGGSLFRTLTRVTIPLLAPALLSGMSLVLVIAMDMFGVAAILGFPARVTLLATEVYVNVSQTPPAYGRATVEGLMLIALTLIIIILQQRFLARRSYAVVGGRGFRAKPLALGKWKPVALGLCWLYILIAVILPLFVLTKTSFQLYPTPQFTAWTLDNWLGFFTRADLFQTLIRSLYLSVFGATICVVFTMAIAYVVHRTRMPGRHLLEQISSLPVAIPGIVLGFGVIWAYITWPIWGTVWILVLAYITLFMPYGVRAFGSNLMQIHPELEESSRVHRASWFRTFRLIVMPLLRSGVYSTWIMMFIIFVREISAAVLLTSVNTQVFPVMIFNQWNEGNFTTMSAGALLLSVIMVAVLTLFRWGFKVDVVPTYR